MQELHGLMEIGERLMWLQSLAHFFFTVILLLADVVAMDPRIVCTSILGFEKDGLVVFPRYHFYARSYIFRLRPGLF